MKNKILKSLRPVFGVASFIMLLAWLNHSVSGWVWFSLLLIFIFLSEYED
jgi:hypothetical protein